ncbi:hypothetical protein CNR22_14955 [Sphingobacteriaceae bacterium]|nr:hypothetical protein CNR22_14955 [Sphingobacteriaceae bacterium]
MKSENPNMSGVIFRQHPTLKNKNGNKKCILFLVLAGLLKLSSAQTSGALIGIYTQGTSGSTYYSKIQDVASGLIAASNSLTGVNHNYGKTTYDEAGKRYFCTTNLGITIIDAQTNSVLGNVVPPAYFDALEYNPNTGKLVGVCHYTSDLFFTLDISTGVTTTLSTIPTVFSPQLGEGTFDVAGNRHFYRLTAGNVLVLDAATGALIKTIGVDISSIEFNPNSGELIGCAQRGGEYKFCRVNVSTGLITSSITLTGVQDMSGESTFDAVGNRYFVNTNLGTTIIDPTTGVIITSIPRALYGLEYIGNISIPVGISEISSGNSDVLKVYPNPCATVINIENGAAMKINRHSVRINNSLGQEVYKQELTQNAISINASTLPGKGIYYLQLLDSDGKILERRKIILQ